MTIIIKLENASLDCFKHILLEGYVDTLGVSESKLDDCIVHKEVEFNPTFRYY